MCSRNVHDSEENRESSISSTLAYFLLLFCAIAIICPLIVDLFFHPEQKVEIRVKSTDTIPAQTLIIDKSNLDSMFYKIEEYELKLNERYDYILEQKENEFKWQTYITFIIGIIVSICGFFGYKSLRELKEDVQKDTKKWSERTAHATAESVAHTTAETTARKVAEQTARAAAEETASSTAQRVSEEKVKIQLPIQMQQYLRDNLQKEVAAQMDNLFKSKMYDALKADILEVIAKNENPHRRRSKTGSASPNDEDLLLPKDENVDIMFQNKK